MSLSRWNSQVPCTPAHSNLQCFLDSVTPTVHTQLSMSYVHALSSRGRQPLGKDMLKCFSLCDLWNFYDEWSAYGAVASIILNSGETAVQYYSPSLSAIQIYTSKSYVSFRRMGKNCIEKLDSESNKMSVSLSNNSSRTSDDSTIHQEGSLPTMNQLGNLYLQYNETSSPYDRVPLSEKINELSKTHPGLMKFRSSDLSPYSWMAVAWYPIYQIPATRKVKELSACFLTYHMLSPSFHGLTNTILEKDDIEKNIYSLGAVGFGSGGVFKRDSNEISLSPFAVATYKMFGKLWMNPQASDHQRIVSRQKAAYSWLKQLRFQHHDFNFFISRSSVP